MATCTFCERIEQFKSGQQPSDLIRELETGYLLLHWFQYYMGYCLFVSKMHATELDDLPAEFAQAYYLDMMRAHRAVRQTVRPVKMNVASLGNEIAHVHWHLIPRHGNDWMPDKPIWDIPIGIRQNHRYRITETSHANLIQTIRLNLR